MDLEGKRPQMFRQLELPFKSQGEALRIERSEEEPAAVHGDERSGTSDRMEKVVSRSNLQAALKRVRKNKGSPGIDGMTVDELADHLRGNWPHLRGRRLAGRYRPAMVKQQRIPKSGGGVRKLGIPTVLDRFIQQAWLQVLQPMIDPTFSQHSHGFRPGRRAHDAVVEAQRYVQQGRSIVVDVDLEQFFDRVNHDVLMGRLAKRMGDGRVLGLLTRLYTKLRLRVNASKSAVDPATRRKLLGYSFWVAPGRGIKRRVSAKALGALKVRVRAITRRTGGRRVELVVDKLREYLTGWKQYYRLAETPNVFAQPDEWLRHRLRATHLKYWKRGKTIYRERRRRGLSKAAAAKVAANGRRWWRNSAMIINIAFPIRYFDELGLPRLAA